ncbi:MAG TPA: 23S rRNA (guanosine(2251)-2'-O)-methyltransferase RlmB [Stellaceae bacterium]|nr:23S rRNA (guanosine(2251)-2'-O)-methyltransferase RlmB [Stellaceae bacterium]
MRSKPVAGVPSEAERPPTSSGPPSGGTWLYGHHPVVAALRNPARKILRVVATAEVMAELGPALTTATEHAIETLPRDAITRLLPAGSVHQGLAALVRPLRPPAIEDIIDEAAGRPNSIVLVLDQVTDPHNVGAVLRSAAAFGALAVVMPERSAPDVSGVLAKAASGALEHVPLVRVVNLVRALEQLQGAGFWTVGLAGEAEKPLATLGLTGRIVLVLGSEGEGLRRLTREACDHLARLPTKGAVDSLNVSNAAAVALYELVRADA